MTPQTIWRTVVNHIPPVPKPKQPAKKRVYTPEQVARRNALRRERYKETYVKKRKDALLKNLDFLDEVPKKLVEVVDYTALIARLKNGPMVVEYHDVETLRHIIKRYGSSISIRTVRADVDGGVRIVTELRIKE